MSHDMTTPGVAGWIQHSGPDAAAAKKFYAEVVGWTISDMPMQDGAEFLGGGRDIAVQAQRHFGLAGSRIVVARDFLGPS